MPWKAEACLSNGSLLLMLLQGAEALVQWTVVSLVWHLVVDNWQGLQICRTLSHEKEKGRRFCMVDKVFCLLMADQQIVHTFIK